MLIILSRQDYLINAEQHNATNDLNRLIWLCAGLFGNIIGVFVAYIYQPSPPLPRLYQKSDEYQLFYNDAYKSKLRSGQLTYTLIGIAILVGFYVLLIGGVIFLQFSLFNL